MVVEQKLQGLGMPIPDIEAEYRQNRSGAHFVSHLAVQNLLYVSGSVAIRDGQAFLPGLVGRDLTIEQGYEAAR